MREVAALVVPPELRTLLNNFMCKNTKKEAEASLAQLLKEKKPEEF